MIASHETYKSYIQYVSFCAIYSEKDFFYNGHNQLFHKRQYTQRNSSNLDICLKFHFKTKTDNDSAYQCWARYLPFELIYFLNPIRVLNKNAIKPIEPLGKLLTLQLY